MRVFIEDAERLCLKQILYFILEYLFIWVPWVLVVAYETFVVSCGIFCCGAQSL